MRIIAGHYKNLMLNAPKGSKTRPTSSQLRETVFNICQNTIEDSVFLDLFAGSGAMGLEAVSRGAKESFFIENDSFAIKCIKENIMKLKVEDQSKLMPGDVFQNLKRLSKKQQQFNLIFADPPYDACVGDHSFGLHTLIIIDQLNLLSDGGMLFIEDAKGNIEEGLPLTVLKLVNSRNSGRTTLFQYTKKLKDQKDEKDTKG
jgi:16S rRNA (guanine(966)-N(2))-methyltransferase RsmD